MTQTLKSEKNYKIAVMGDVYVGKSSLVMRYITDEFRGKVPCTFGAAFYIKKIIFNNEIIKLNIWDTAGQERFQAMMPLYYRGAHAVMLVYDVGCHESYNRALKIMCEVLSNDSKQSSLSSYPIFFLVGNKSDLPEQDRQISEEEIQSCVFQNGVIAMETSAKTGHNVNEVFLKIVDAISKLEVKSKLENQESMKRIIQLHEVTRKEKKCCI